MRVRVLQLNIFMGKWLDEVIKYVKKENFDILIFQEVSGGRVSFHRDNTFQKIIDLGYDGELLANWRVKGFHGSFFGNATFFKRSFTLLERTEIWLKSYRDIEDPDNRESRDDPKAPLSLLLEKNGIQLRVVNAHLAWNPTPNDTKEKIRQAKIFYNYLKTIDAPFIITGDFNVEKDTQVVKMIDKIGRNLAREHNVINTLNSRKHKAPHLFPPGLAVDYAYVSDDIRVEKFEVLDMDLSDHLGIYLELVIK